MCGQSSSLARHRRIHTGRRPYLCGAHRCGKSFCRKTTLIKHARRAHGIGQNLDVSEDESENDDIGLIDPRPKSQSSQNFTQGRSLSIFRPQLSIPTSPRATSHQQQSHHGHHHPHHQHHNPLSFHDGYGNAVYQNPPQSAIVQDHPLTPTSPYCFPQQPSHNHVSPFPELPRSCSEDFISDSLAPEPTGQYNANLRIVCTSGSEPHSLLQAHHVQGSPGELSNCSTATSGHSVDYFYRSPVSNQATIEPIPQIVNQGNVALYIHQTSGQTSIEDQVGAESGLGDIPIVMSQPAPAPTGIWYGYSQFDQQQFHNNNTQRIYYENSNIDGISPAKQQSDSMMQLLTPRPSLC